MSLTDAHKDHPRNFQGENWAYPVLSRRSQGISVGVNLSQAKTCNFNCLYCQVRREQLSAGPRIDFSLENLEKQITRILQTVISGRLYSSPPFDQTPTTLRRLNDIAFSGDGEPTASPYFPQACKLIVRVKQNLNLNDIKIVLITNSSLLHQPEIIQSLDLLDKHQGQIWAKLDAGTDEFFHFINRTDIPFSQILDNILQTARRRPLIIQTLFSRFNNTPTSPDEVNAYIDRLAHIVENGGHIDNIQLHTIARPPADARLTPLSPSELDQIANQITDRLNTPLKKFYGSAL